MIGSVIGGCDFLVIPIPHFGPILEAYVVGIFKQVVVKDALEDFPTAVVDYDKVDVSQGPLLERPWTAQIIHRTEVADQSPVASFVLG